MTFDGPVAAFDRTRICFVIGGVVKVVFYPEVEDYSLLEIDLNRTQKLQKPFAAPGQWIQVEFGGMASLPKHRQPLVPAADGTEYIVPFWTAIIGLVDGVPTSITWDDNPSCLGCSGDSCVDGFCAIPSTQCDLADGKNDCDVKIYIGWFGTDRNGRYLKSAGKRLSRFRNFSLNTAFTNAYQTASDSIPSAPTFSPTLPDAELGGN